MKKAHSITGEKELEHLKLDLLQKYTGYIRGGCSPLGMIHTYPTYIDELAELEDFIYVSAGLRGYQIKIKPEDLQRAAKAEFVDFTGVKRRAITSISTFTSLGSLATCTAERAGSTAAPSNAFA